MSKYPSTLLPIYRASPGWTLEKSIQAHIDIYASHATFTEVKHAFPYLVSKEFASGGGDVCFETVAHQRNLTPSPKVPQFRWHTIDPNQPFMVGDTGIKVTPFSGTLYASSMSYLKSDVSSSGHKFTTVDYLAAVRPHPRGFLHQFLPIHLRLLGRVIQRLYCQIPRCRPALMTLFILIFVLASRYLTSSTFRTCLKFRRRRGPSSRQQGNDPTRSLWWIVYESSLTHRTLVWRRQWQRREDSVANAHI